VVVLTDGQTPWPADAPKGMHIVIGLIRVLLPGQSPDRVWAAPGWARLVEIDE
jgi:hypothetical protein